MTLEDYRNKWIFSRDSFDGVGGYIDGENLVKFTREDDEKFQNRKDIAFYVNHLKPSIKRFVDNLFKKSAMRDYKNPILEEFKDNCDLKNNSIENFMKDFSQNFKIRGCNLVLVDMPNSEDEQQKDRKIPYLVEILPERVYQYKMDKFGKFEWIIWEFEVDISEPFKDSKKELNYMYYDSLKWEHRGEDKDTIIASGEHNLGLVPIVPLGKFPVVGDYVQIADISKNIYNKQSELDLIFRDQTFSILAYQLEGYIGDDDGTPKITLSTDNLLTYGGNNAPQFISPNTQSAQIYQEEIKRLETKIDDISKKITGSNSTETADSMKHRFEELNSELIATAKDIEDFEKNMIDVVFKWLNIENYEIEIIYPQEFNLADLKTEIETLEVLSTYAPNSYLQAKLKKIMKIDLQNLSNEKFDEIIKEIDEKSFEVVDTETTLNIDSEV